LLHQECFLSAVVEAEPGDQTQSNPVQGGGKHGTVPQSGAVKQGGLDIRNPTLRYPPSLANHRFLLLHPPQRHQLNSRQNSHLPNRFLIEAIILLASGGFLCNIPTLLMKAKIIVTPKKAVLDPQGKTVQSALEHMGYQGVQAVHVGKYLEVELTGKDKDSARKQMDEACRKFLTNPVIEDFHLEITD
jgi:phosphoribosylformylglycinamidine synthase